MSLKDKIKDGRGIRGGYPYEIIEKKDFNDAVNLYLDARDHPEKYPSLFWSFDETIGGSLLMPLKEAIRIMQQNESANWRDFLFNKIIGEAKK